MEQEIAKIREEALKDLSAANTMEALQEVRLKYLGKKGALTRVLRGMGGLSPEERPRLGQLANEVRVLLENGIERMLEDLSRQEQMRQLATESVDVTLPGRPAPRGHQHPLTTVLREIERIFASMGFEVAEGPEVEWDYYNFEALNIPKGHPARDMQDSFYITDEMLLRTHTSPMQVRTMEKTVPRLPVRVIVPGKVYRRDDDATHSPMFHQVEGLLVDQRCTLGDLKGVLLAFARQMFGPDREIRMRPSFFPFTEPSVEVDVSCFNCVRGQLRDGSRCPLCKGSGWLEILGAGMVDPNVFAYVREHGYDPERVTGFAFGLGIERIAMLRHGVPDLRMYYENDVRLLEQFGAR